MKALSYYKYKRKIGVANVLHFCSKPIEKVKILFFGTDQFSLQSLKKLHEQQNQSKIELLEVVTSFKSPINPIRKYATDFKIPLHKWPFCTGTVDIKRFNLGIVVSFGYLIPSNIISEFSMGMINLHASLLPRWRGAAPIVHAIANGDDKTGVSIMKIEPKHFDIGDILYQEEVFIEKHMLMPQLRDILATVGSELILKTIQNYPKCFKEFKKQNEHLVSYASKVSQTMTEIKWSTMTAKQIYDLYRALYGYKNLSTKFKNLNLKIIEVIFEEDFNLEYEKNLSRIRCGSIKYCKKDNTIDVLCKNLKYIKVKKLKIEGKKVMTASEFNNGFLKKLKSEELYFE